MAEALRRHPLAGREFAGPGVRIEPLPEAERVSLRAPADSLAALGRAIGLDLPGEPRAVAASGETRAVWLGPDEWFLVAPSGTGLTASLDTAGDHACSAVDISHRNTAIAVSGRLAAAVLNAGCPLDLSDGAFPVDSAARTVLAKAEIVLIREAQDRFRVECWRSFADYVWRFLVDAARSS